MQVEQRGGSPPPESEGEGEDLRPGMGGDSSEEESEGSAEERAIREGFIVDDEEDGSGRRRHKKHKKRRKHKSSQEGGKLHSLRQELGELDEDDLDLIGLGSSSKPGSGARKLRRLRQAASDAGSDDLDNSMANIFDEDREEPAGAYDEDDLGDFIADEEYDEEDEEGGIDRAQAKRRRLQAQKGTKRGKRKFRGLQSMLDRDAWEEISDIFGTGDEYAWAMELDPTDADVSKKPDLADIFEPAEISQRHLTQADEKIRQVDLPERFQLLQRAYLPSIKYDSEHPLLQEDEIPDAAAYIAPRISQQYTDQYLTTGPEGQENELKQPFIDCIHAVLTQMHLDHFCEVSFIAVHRSDLLCMPGSSQAFIDRAGLWRVLHLSFEYRGLLERRKSLTKRFERLNVPDPYYEKYLYPRCATSLEGTSDLAEWLRLTKAARARKIREEDPMVDEKPNAKQAARKTKYDIAKEDSAVSGYAEEAAISPRALVQAFLNITPAPAYTDPDLNTPEAEAERCTNDTGTFSSGSHLQNAATHILVQEISHDPLLRDHFRQLFSAHAAVSVQPTERGQAVIDEGHPCSNFKYLKAKPFSRFANSPQFLQIVNAEQEGLLTAELKLSLQARQDLEQALYAIYAPSESAWDQWRGGIITQVIDLLQIHGAEWMRQKLIKDTQEAILRRVSDTFEHRIECIPYTRDPDPSNENRGETPSVLAVSAGAGELRKDDVHAVYLNNKGQLRQSKKFETLAPVPEHRSDAERLRSSSNREEFKQWVQEKQPTVIVVGGWTIRTRELLGDVTNLTEGLNIPVIMVEDSTARLYRNSPKAAEEHHSLHEVAKYCLGLARYVQSPAAEFANLPPGVLESISFDPFQKLVPVERLRFELEQSLVNVVHYTGVDINKAARDPYYAESLPYVPGLGQRKARSLLDKLKQAGGTLLNRADMLNKGMITAKVFWNATAFIRIDQGFLKSASLDEVDSEDHPDILDATRIHNEDYEIARKMASDAVELDDEDIQNLDHPSESVKMLLQDDVKKLDELRLDDFAEELAKIMDQPKRLTLYRIREELQRPFFDARPAMPMPTPLEQFQQITGETVETLRTGKIVPVVVLRVQKDRSVLVRFDSGVLGKIEAGYIFDASQVDGQGEVVTAPENLLQNNDTVRAAILGGIDQPRDTLNGIMGKDFLFQLDCRPQQVASRGEQEQSFERRQLSLDEFYDIEAAQQYETAQETKNQKKSGRQRRLIQHDNFHNFNAGQAEEYLSSQSRGDCVIRPSGKGVHNLTCTWKVADGIYQHFDILELEKPGGNDLALGRRLQVGLGNSRVTYHDLDELIYSHVRATADRVEEMIRHEKFKGTKEDTVSFCRNFQMANPNKPIYAFAIETDKSRAGNFLLTYIVSRGQEAKHWTVKVNPRGFVLAGSQQTSELGSVADLCNAFKVQYAMRSTGQAGGQTQYGNYGKTPQYGGATPYASRVGGRTPMAGGKTPLVSGRTPVYRPPAAGAYR